MLVTSEHKSENFTRDRRKSDRQISIFRLAKIQSGSAEGWGFIKNISNSGVMVEISPQFQLDGTAKVALTEDVELASHIRWRKGSLVGMQFLHDINVAELLANLTVHNKMRPSRLPRVQLSQSILIRIGSTLLRAEIRDISPGGMCVHAGYSCEIGNNLTLSVPELGELDGTVRWQKGPEIGIKFHQRVPVPQITGWLANHYAQANDD
ncbi:MAG: PilZ domain-containing protein [Parasphingorhabdus sp.]|uniref:PilZ domain-containing protein n=1 Tax=Parasphingorhabdus sp. TaxID=2709688 RepID=UPI0032987710